MMMPVRLACLGANGINASAISALMTAQTMIWLVMPCGRKAEGFYKGAGQRECRIVGQRGNEGGCPRSRRHRAGPCRGLRPAAGPRRSCSAFIPALTYYPAFALPAPL